MPRDDGYLEDMRLAGLDVAQYLGGVARKQFLADGLLQSAVVRKIEVMGEASTRVSEQFKTSHPEVAVRRSPWVHN